MIGKMASQQRWIETEARGMCGVRLLAELGRSRQREERDALHPGGGRQTYSSAWNSHTGQCDLCHAGRGVARGTDAIGGGGHDQESTVGGACLARGREDVPPGVKGAGLAREREGDVRGAGHARGRGGEEREAGLARGGVPPGVIGVARGREIGDEDLCLESRGRAPRIEDEVAPRLAIERDELKFTRPLIYTRILLLTTYWLLLSCDCCQNVLLTVNVCHGL